MTAPLTHSSGIAHDAIAVRCGLASAYATSAANLAAAGDTAAMLHSLGCAARTILAAVEAAETLRPSGQGGGR
jgi:hypothetical protein